MHFAAITLLFQLFAPARAARPWPDMDSVRVHRDARGAQSEFERQRRHRVPISWWSGAGRCDVRVGRFCYWHDEDAPRGPEEPPSIGKLRADLTSRLDSAAGVLPGDTWIAGQRVRYLVESARVPEALAAATVCRATTWWCAALAGLVLHAGQRFAEADSAFDLALHDMPPPQRCEWEDATDLLPPRASKRYAKMSCDERRAWMAPVWALADPMWSRDGNDRRTEHYARHVMSMLERDSRSAYELRWGKDSHELIVRFGWPERWSREPGSAADPSAIRMIGHESHPAFEFFPADSAVASPEALTGAAWTFRTRDARSRYAPPYARRVVNLDAQVTRFFRGDSALVIAAFNVPSDTSFDVNGMRGALAVEHAEGTERPFVRALSLSGSHGVARTLVAPARVFVGVELTDSSHRSLARARVALDAASRAEMGLLLYADPAPSDAALDDVLDRALGNSRVSRRQRLGLYWEHNAPVTAGDSATYILTVYPRSASWLTRLARSMRLAEAAAPVHIRFTEQRGGGAHNARALGVDVSRLPPGTYDVRVRVEVEGAEVGRATRTVVVDR